MRRLLPVVWLMALLLTPAVAYLLGERQGLLENRPATPFPAVQPTEKAAFEQFDAALRERLPLREQALQARAAIALDVFGFSPNPQVRVGDDGWLYFADDVAPCVEGTQPKTDPAEAVDLLARSLVAGGKSATVVLAASKLFVHDEHAPRLDPEHERCLRDLEARMDARLAAAPGGTSITGSLRAHEERGEPTFLRQDTHWNWRGRELFARRVLDRIRPGLADEVGLGVGAPYEHRGDLDVLMGRRATERDRRVEASRPPRSPFDAGEVVLIGDSQLQFSLVTPFDGAAPIRDVALAGQPACTWPEVAVGSCDEAVAAARTVVVELVSRGTRLVTRSCGRLVTAALDGRRGTPGGAYEPAAGGKAADRLRFDATGRAHVRVVPPGADAADDPRLMRLPLDRLGEAANGDAAVSLAQTPVAGAAVPCATVSQDREGSALYLPLPAGRAASDLALALTAPPGTVLGEPEVIRLDGRVAPLDR